MFPPISLPPSSLLPLRGVRLLHVTGNAQEEERVHARENACMRGHSHSLKREIRNPLAGLKPRTLAINLLRQTFGTNLFVKNYSHYLYSQIINDSRLEGPMFDSHVK